MAIKHLEYNNGIYEINYEILNYSCENTIIFLHGWGANKEIMKQAFGNLFKNYKHLYIDMPGFGRSPNDNILNTMDYANIILSFMLLNQIDRSKTTIIGHSFGGKVAVLLQPKYLILLSSAGIKERKRLKILFIIKIAKFFNAIGLKKITKILRSSDTKSMNEGMYQTFKNVVDEDFTKYFSNCNAKTSIFWGNQDKATPVESGQTINKLIKNSKFYKFDGDHYFFLKNAKKIEQILLDTT
jgi:pimeloyl-ACP methyl ester carboxylesterase